MYAFCKVKNIGSETATYCGQELTVGQEYQIQDFERVRWASDDAVLNAITNDLLQVGGGSQWLVSYSEQLDLLRSDTMPEKDSSNKEMVHQTSCPFGYITGWFGQGDDINYPHMVGDGVRLICDHAVSDSSPLEVVADLNIKENGTYIHEGFLDCLGAINDYVHAEVIPVITPSEAGSDTYFNNYNGVIVPAAGDGTLVVNPADMKPVEVFMDPNTKKTPAAYWNFDYDEEQHTFSNPTAAPLGDGKYNLFASDDVPTIFPKRFWHALPMLGNTSKWLQSADAVPLGSNMRIRCYFYTHGDDHAWHAALTVAFHRQRLI